jgi:hypothetical protein
LTLLLSAAPAAAQLENLPPDVQTTIAAMGPALNADMFTKSFAAMRPLQAARTDLQVAKDVTYGTDPLQKFDLWRPKGAGADPSCPSCFSSMAGDSSVGTKATMTTWPPISRGMGF